MLIESNDEDRSPWYDERSELLVKEFAEDEDIIEQAVCYWLGADDAYSGALLTVYGFLPDGLQYELLVDYIEHKDMEIDFNDWYRRRENV